MMDKPIVMESTLGRLVYGLKPERSEFKFASQDKWFLHIMNMVAVYGLMPEVGDITFEVSCWYEFSEIKRQENNGFVAVFVPQYYIAVIEDGQRRGWRVFYRRFREDLAEILGKKVEEIDIPDIEEMSLVEINPDGKLIEKGKYWKIAK